MPAGRVGKAESGSRRIFGPSRPRRVLTAPDGAACRGRHRQECELLPVVTTDEGATRCRRSAGSRWRCAGTPSTDGRRYWPGNPRRSAARAPQRRSQPVAPTAPVPPARTRPGRAPGHPRPLRYSRSTLRGGGAVPLCSDAVPASPRGVGARPGGLRRTRSPGGRAVSHTPGAVESRTPSGAAGAPARSGLPLAGGCDPAAAATGRLRRGAADPRGPR